MANEGNEDREYRAYMVRMWQVRCDGQLIWRASVENAHSGERRAFADLGHLFTFLEETALCGQFTVQDKEHQND